MSIEFSVLNTFSVGDPAPTTSLDTSDLTRYDESTIFSTLAVESSFDSVYHVNSGKGHPRTKKQQKMINIRGMYE